MSAFGLNQIGQIAVTVSDLDRSVKFYRDTLGIPFLFQAPPGLAFFNCDGLRLLLETSAEDNPHHHSSILYFKVDDIQNAFKELSSRGLSWEAEPHVVAEMPDHTLWMAFFRDPDGNLLALMSEVPLNNHNQ